MRLPFPRLLALAGLALAAAACVDYHPVIITGVKPLQIDAGGCSVNAGAADIIRGSLDSNRGGGYVLGLAVDNLLASDSDSNRTNTNIAYVDQVVVAYRAAGGASFAAPAGQTTNVSVVIAAGGHVTFPATVLTKDNAAAVTGQTGDLLVDVTLAGRLADNSSFTTPKFTFPVGLCTDCVKPCDADKHQVACSEDSVGQADGFICE